MIETVDLRIILRTPLVEAIEDETITSITTDDIAWENQPFEGKSFFIQEWLISINDEPPSNSTSGGYGIYQLNIYIEKNQGTEKVESLSDILKELYESKIFIKDGISVVVDNITQEQATDDRGFLVFPVRISYRKYK